MLVFHGVYSEPGQIIRAQWSNKKMAVRPGRWNKKRGRLSWESSSPLSIAWQPLPQVQECIMERAGDEERASAERRKVNQVHWSKSECRWTILDLSPSSSRIFTTGRTTQMWRVGWGPHRCLEGNRSYFCYICCFITILPSIDQHLFIIWALQC